MMALVNIRKISCSLYTEKKKENKSTASDECYFTYKWALWVKCWSVFAEIQIDIKPVENEDPGLALGKTRGDPLEERCLSSVLGSNACSGRSIFSNTLARKRHISHTVLHSQTAFSHSSGLLESPVQTGVPQSSVSQQRSGITDLTGRSGIYYLKGGYRIIDWHRNLESFSVCFVFNSGAWYLNSIPDCFFF